MVWGSYKRMQASEAVISNLLLFRKIDPRPFLLVKICVFGPLSMAPFYKTTSLDERKACKANKTRTEAFLICRRVSKKFVDSSSDL